MPRESAPDEPTSGDVITLESRFLEVMAAVCTPVTVITTNAKDRPHGTTVSAFASLSLRPPMVLVALDNDSELLSLVRVSGRFGVNVMGREQSSIALGFAKKGSDKFEGVPWSRSSELPRLDGALGWLACEAASFTPGGDHVVVLGTVLDAEVGPGEPLTYHSRLFGTHSPIEFR